MEAAGGPLSAQMLMPRAQGQGRCMERAAYMSAGEATSSCRTATARQAGRQAQWQAHLPGGGEVGVGGSSKCDADARRIHSQDCLRQCGHQAPLRRKVPCRHLLGCLGGREGPRVGAGVPPLGGRGQLACTRRPGGHHQQMNNALATPQSQNTAGSTHCALSQLRRRWWRQLRRRWRGQHPP